MLKRISLVSFRGHNRELNFGPGTNLLCGPNESGKSTVKEAIAFAWFGTDSVDTKNPDHLITDGQDYCEVAVETPHVTVTRRKRRGATSTIKIARSGLPPVAMNQTELNGMLRISLDAFMSCWNVGYFMELGSNEQIAILGELAQVDRKALLLSMLPEGMQIPAKVKLANPKVDADAMAGERRQVQNMKASDEGGLSQVLAQLQQLGAVETVDTESYSARLNDINAELEQHDFYKRALAKYQADRVRFEADQERKSALDIEMQTLKGTPIVSVDELAKQAHDLDNQANDLGAKYAALRTELQGMPAPPQKPDLKLDTAVCSTCGQRIDEQHVKSVMGAYENQLVEYNKAAREIQSHNDNVVAEQKKLFEAGQAARNKAAELKREMKAIHDRNTQTTARIGQLEQELYRISMAKAPAAPTKPTSDEAALRKEQLDISTAINVARRQADQVVGLQSQADLLKKAIQTRDQQVVAYGLLEQALRDLPGVETRRLLETLTVDGVKVELVDGKLMVMNASSPIPYSSLSRGRKMKVGLAFCASLCRAAGNRAPKWLFLDDSDLVDVYQHLLPQGTQVFVAKVDGELQELMVVSG